MPGWSLLLDPARTMLGLLLHLLLLNVLPEYVLSASSRTSPDLCTPQRNPGRTTSSAARSSRPRSPHLWLNAPSFASIATLPFRHLGLLSYILHLYPPTPSAGSSPSSLSVKLPIPRASFNSSTCRSEEASKLAGLLGSPCSRPSARQSHSARPNVVDDLFGEDQLLADLKGRRRAQ